MSPGDIASWLKSAGNPLRYQRQWGQCEGARPRVDWRTSSSAAEPCLLTMNGLPLEQIRTPKMARVEAVLLVANSTMTLRKLMALATLVDVAEAREQIGQLNRSYESSGTPYRIEKLATGYRIMTNSEYSRWLEKLHQRQAELKLSPPAMETLTIIAYQQPLTRADVEAIRGVQSSEMIKQLMERGLVRIGGEDDSLGRPFLYETTRKFLDLFGLASLEDLPDAGIARKSLKSTSAEPSEDAEAA